MPRVSEPKSPLFLFRGPRLDQWGMGSNGLQTGCDLLSKFREGHQQRFNCRYSRNTQLKDGGEEKGPRKSHSTPWPGTHWVR